ncbi:hypothetical protein K9L16_00920 [Candidatus Pacearchaeota archaeon]|nr:hypothetical protein [Candidatus Pacearchaeota archaeon]
MVKKKLTKSKKHQANKNKLALSFYSSIGIALIIHYFFINGIGINSTAQMALSFLIFNLIFGFINILLKIDFGGKN